MGYAGYAPGHKVVELTVLQQLLKLIKSDKSLETLEKLTRNTAQAPAEEKFRKVRRGSAIASTASTRARPRIPANRPPATPEHAPDPRERDLAERNGTVATRPRVSGRRGDSHSTLDVDANAGHVFSSRTRTW